MPRSCVPVICCIPLSIFTRVSRVRKERGIGQTELVRMLQLRGLNMTREILVKIERGIQHITGTQLRCIRDCLETSYDELLKVEKGNLTALKNSQYEAYQNLRKYEKELHTVQTNIDTFLGKDRSQQSELEKETTRS